MLPIREYSDFKMQIPEIETRDFVVLDVFEATFDEYRFNIIPFRDHASVYGNLAIAGYLADQLKAMELLP
jgi:hypothetical protein